MARHLHPSTAPEPWLDFVARWLGLPWDDALSGEQKRALLSRAAILARSRGTRAGLEIADAEHLRLLRARRERRQQGRAEARDE